MKVVEIQHAIICDEVRREDNGKLFYIGVYGSALILNKSPNTIRLFLALRLKVDGAGETDFEVEVLRNGERENTGRGVMSIEGEAEALMPLGPIMIKDARDGDRLEFKIKFGDQEFGTVASIPIVVSSSISASGE